VFNTGNGNIDHNDGERHIICKLDTESGADLSSPNPNTGAGGLPAGASGMMASPAQVMMPVPVLCCMNQEQCESTGSSVGDLYEFHDAEGEIEEVQTTCTPIEEETEEVEPTARRLARRLDPSPTQSWAVTYHIGATGTTSENLKAFFESDSKDKDLQALMSVTLDGLWPQALTFGEITIVEPVDATVPEPASAPQVADPLWVTDDGCCGPEPKNLVAPIRHCLHDCCFEKCMNDGECAGFDVRLTRKDKPEKTKFWFCRLYKSGVSEDEINPTCSGNTGNQLSTCTVKTY